MADTSQTVSLYQKIDGKLVPISSDTDEEKVDEIIEDYLSHHETPAPDLSQIEESINNLNTIATSAQTSSSLATSTANTAKELADNAVPRTGQRGNLAGSQTAEIVEGSQTISIDSPDSLVIKTSGNVTLTFVPASEEAWCVKNICLKSQDATALTIESGSWSNVNDRPVWGDKGKTLILTALFVGGQVVLFVNYNDQ